MNCKRYDGIPENGERHCEKNCVLRACHSPERPSKRRKEERRCDALLEAQLSFWARIEAAKRGSSKEEKKEEKKSEEAG